MDDLKNILECLLFVAEEPLTVERLRGILSISDSAVIRDTLQVLMEEHESRKGAFILHEVAGGYQFRTRPAYVPWIKRLLQTKPSRLSRAALETLAIVAYKQPVMRSDIEHLRGVDCGGVLRMLLEKKLIRVLGRKEIPGRPLIYGTTRHFLEVFDLKNLKDLPSIKEIETLEKNADGMDDTSDGDASAPEKDPNSETANNHQ